MMKLVSIPIFETAFMSSIRRLFDVNRMLIRA